MQLKMNTAIVIFCFVAAIAATPLEQRRLNRDVSEILAANPVNEYPPPESMSIEPEIKYLPLAEPVEAAEIVIETESSSASREVNAPEEFEVVEAATEPVPDTAAFGENGYEYRTIRKLRLRQRRDVSHLNLGYLPPVEKPRVASTYLPPPQLDVPQDMPQLKISNEYLPPVNEELVATTKTVETETPTIETTSTESPSTETPTTEAPSTESPSTEAPTTTTTESAPVETAVLAEDGYHYRKPAVLPDLGFPTLVKMSESDALSEVPEPQPEIVQNVPVEMTPEPEQLQPTFQQAPEPEQEIVAQPELAYLPPLEPGMVVVEGPGQESAALLDDGYHYRVVKQVTLF